MIIQIKRNEMNWIEYIIIIHIITQIDSLSSYYYSYNGWYGIIFILLFNTDIFEIWVLNV